VCPIIGDQQPDARILHPRQQTTHAELVDLRLTRTSNGVTSRDKSSNVEINSRSHSCSEDKTPGIGPDGARDDSPDEDRSGDRLEATPGWHSSSSPRYRSDR
jgi:hypothetical protein